jgi:hypothetical protein
LATGLDGGGELLDRGRVVGAAHVVVVEDELHERDVDEVLDGLDVGHGWFSWMMLRSWSAQP